MWSIITGVMGALGTWVAVIYVERRGCEWRARHYWFLGLAGLFPAWLSAFLGLLPPVARAAVETPLPPPAILSSGAALFCIIITDYLLRRLQRSGLALRAVTYWIIGLVALLPAWLIALVGFR